MDASLVPQFFAHDVRLFRRHKHGGCKPIRTINGGRLVVTFEGERIDAAAIVWCLHYGNWPRFPLTILDGDPENLSLDNIYPVRLHGVRYREHVTSAGLFQHPLSDLQFRTSRECKAHWVVLAREHYQKDMTYVLQLEARDRALAAQAVDRTAEIRRQYEARQEASRKARAAVLARNAGTKEKAPPKPRAIEGMVWHYYKKVWQSVPPPVHVSDDCRRRCCAFLRGAVRAEFQPHHQETWYFDAAGEVVKPLPHKEFMAKPTQSQ
jgi:hypothetical protein